jgi:tetratricopeptide (TPR) repeat protein
VRLNNLGTVCSQLGWLAEAADHQSEALALNQELGVRGGEASNLSNLGENEHQLGRIEQALDHLSQALRLHREVGDRRYALELATTAAALARDTGIAESKPRRSTPWPRSRTA